MNRIDRTFTELRRRSKKAFIAYITAGYPDVQSSEAAILELCRRGVDIIEIGIPFSDPVADGPVIQEASFLALRKKVFLRSAFALAARVREKTDVPLCFMSYYNPIFRMGDEVFLEQARASGLDGLIVPDLPFEESGLLRSRARKSGISLIPFISPMTGRERMQRIVSAAEGFIYYISVTGVTGSRQQLPGDLTGNIRAIRRYTSVPVCAGFGISTRSQVRSCQSVADGVIVGSAILQAMAGARNSREAAERAGRAAQRLMAERNG